MAPVVGADAKCLLNAGEPPHIKFSGC